MGPGDRCGLTGSLKWEFLQSPRVTEARAGLGGSLKLFESGTILVQSH